MWQRLALRLIAAAIAFSACSHPDRQEVDKLNALSYAAHYRSLDSTEHYASQALRLSADYPDGQAEARNNLAFVRIAQMRYDDARLLLDSIPPTTDNQLELLVAYIQQMRLCQRMSENRAFYDYREKAKHALRRIDEERDVLTPSQQQRLVYAESELAIVTSTYYYYVGLERLAAQALQQMPTDLEHDTTQYMNYLYNVGSGGIIQADTQEEVNQQEFNYLMRCHRLALQTSSTYFIANSLEALAEHLMVPAYRRKLMADNLPAFNYLCDDTLSADSMPQELARKSLHIFQSYGDVYQIAGAHRTLASCHLQTEHYTQALAHLQMALADTMINKAPDLVASIREQLSVAYAAIDDKKRSDENRNLYLDLQEQTRQDRSLEARAGQLEQEAVQLNYLIGAVVGAIVLLILMLSLFYVWHKRRRGSNVSDRTLMEEEEELRDQLAVARLRVEKGELIALEQRAKVSLVNGITPLIDRILYTITRHKTLSDSQVEYISDLTDDIISQNEVLTHWIQLRQGELNLHIETFPLQQLFDILGRSSRSFAMKGVTLQVMPTTASVKADKVLTLFMLNTLADNARKFTPQGGSVEISAAEEDTYVEISVSDTGCGMSQQQLDRLFVVKGLDIADIPQNTAAASQLKEDSHGFGLLNCKGIINKYHKLSSLFSVCMLSAESRVGQGSRFFFRLPKGMARAVTALLSMASTFAYAAGGHTPDSRDILSRASAFADSAYYSNINATYEQTLQHADSCRHYLNTFYRLSNPTSADTLLPLGDPSVTSPEIKWLADSLPINYDIVLTMRNESAVAALSLHQWQYYQYNNRIYTQLFKELSADSTLDDYCRKMQQSQANKQVAIILLVAILLSILAALAWQGILSLGKAARRRQEQQDRLLMMKDDISRAQLEEGAFHVTNAVLDNCLSTLKHETMYYPTSIRRLIDAADTASLPEVVAYYRELYGILSLQATRQTETMRLHVKPIAPASLIPAIAVSQPDLLVLGDAVLLRYLFDLLTKQSGQHTLKASCSPKDRQYVAVVADMPALAEQPGRADNLFTPSPQNIPFLLCRQIVRDHGEATNRRGCAIRVEVMPDVTRMVIVLPRAYRQEQPSRE